MGHEPVILTLSELLSPGECAAEIARAEAAGFDEAPITTSAGFVREPEIRNNTRLMRDDPALAALLWERVAAGVPRHHGYRAVGLNERFRYYRYEPGQYFRLHRDGHYERPDGSARSLLTFMVYLNAGYQGGETRFLDQAVKPEAGMGLLFTHALLHESASLRSGRKYVLRSDVMFAPE